MTESEFHNAVKGSSRKPSAFYRFFSLLTPVRSFTLFVIALAASLVTLVLGPQAQAPYFALIPIALYGVALLLAQTHYLVQLSGTVKDSPYFLGFIMTMIALVKIFLDVGHRTTASESVPVNLIVGEAGGAILATVVGLFMRQVLMSLDPGEDARDAVFQSIAQELREHAVEFHEAQLRFVGLVKEFTKSRERLFVREEAAHTQYLGRLETGAAILARLEEGYPQRVQALLGSVEKARDHFDNSAKISGEELLALSRKLAALVEVDAAKTRDALSGLAGELTSIRAELIKQVTITARELESVVPLLSSQVRAVEGALSLTPDAGHRLVDALNVLSRDTGIGGDALRTFTDQLTKALAAITETSSAVREDTREIHRGVEERSRALQAELQSVDTIIDEFVQVVRMRMRSTNALG